MNVSPKQGAWLRALGLASFVLLLDQAVKSAVRSNIIVGERRDLLGPLDLVRVSNHGVAFGFMDGAGWVVPALTVAALTGVLIWFGRHTSSSLAWIPAGLVLGGALGNLWDRFQAGAVTDFIKLPHWPAFNIADMAITVGVVALVVIAEIYGRDKNPQDS